MLIENDPFKADQLIANNPDYVRDGSQSPGSLGTSFLARGHRAIYWPVEFRRYTQFISLRPQFPWGVSAIAFMGERISPAGHHRLVIIPYGSVQIPVRQGPLPLKESYVISPGGFWAQPKDVSHDLADLLISSGPLSDTNFNPGVADPANPSHITIEYQAYSTDHGHIVDIYLRDDDSLDVHFRNPGAAQPVE